MFTASIGKKSPESKKTGLSENIIFTPPEYNVQEIVRSRGKSSKSPKQIPSPNPSLNKLENKNISPNNRKWDSSFNASGSPSNHNSLKSDESISITESPNQKSSKTDDNNSVTESENNTKVGNTSVTGSTNDQSVNAEDTFLSENDSSTSDNEMKVKPHCSCAQCSLWTNSSGWNCESKSIKITKQLTHTVTPLLKTYTGNFDTKIISVQYSSLSTIQYQSVNRLLVHSTSIPQSIKLISEAYFHKDILLVLKKLNYETTKSLQSYIWPALTRQLNVCMIGDQQIGKTMAYLPFVGSFLLEEDRYGELLKYKQPVIVILCNSSVECEEIFDLASMVLSSAKVALLTYPSTNIRQTDVLITIPSILIECMQRKMLSLKSLCCLVLENAHTMLLRYGDEISKLLRVTNEMLTHRSCDNTVQLIITSEKWSEDLKNMIKTLYCTPMICIQNYLEAALYAKINFQVKLTNSNNKALYLCDILKNKFHLYKTIIICDEDEIDEVRDRLLLRNIGCVCIPNYSNKEDIIKYENEWNSKIDGDFRALLCTDFIFGTMLNVTDANWLIHYSFPSTWTRFVKRFVSLLDNYQSPLSTEKTKSNCQSFLVIDEKSNKQLPKLLSLFKRLDEDLVNYFKQYSDNLTNQMENEKIIAKTPLCRTLKLFGKCPNEFCPSRHIPNNDLDIISNDLPKNGVIRFKIVDIVDVTRYRIKLISHVIGENIRNFDDNTTNELISDEKKNVEIVEVAKFYLYYYVDGLRIIHTKCEVIDIDKEVIKVKLFSNGWTIKTDKSKLFELNESLTPQIYLANFIPPYKDENFCAKSLIQTKRLLNEVDYKSIIFTANICLQLNDTFWVDGISQIVTVTDTDVVPFSLIKELKRLKIVEFDKYQIKHLRKFCTDNGINLPTIVNNNRKIVKKIEEIKPQWAFLEQDDVVQQIVFCSAISPGEFYVRLTKYYYLLENLQKDIEWTRRNPNFDKTVSNVAVGKCYLALDSEDLVYCRVMVKSIEDNKALCLFVDYGDEDIIDITELRHLPNDLIKKLPFQAIHCCLYGIESISKQWSGSAIDILYDFAFEPDSNIYRALFIKVCTVNDTNTIIGMRKIYSVLLKDGYGESHVLINKLLLDCGWARTNPDENYDDFILKIPEKADNSSEQSDEDLSENSEESFKDMELFVVDETAFLELFSSMVDTLPSTKCDTIPALEEYEPTVSEQSQTLPPMKIIKQESDDDDDDDESPRYLTPDVYWSQTIQELKIKIKLTSIKSYKMNISRGTRFILSAQVNPDKTYAFRFVLYRRVENLSHSIIGPEIQVSLRKGYEEMWPRLGASERYMRNVHYEFSDAELDEPKRKFLQLDIPDDVSEEGDGFIMTTEISDCDSDLDEELELSD